MSGTYPPSEARLVYECRKLYWHDFDPDKFLAPRMHVFYPKKDYHRLCVGEIVTVLARYVEGDPTPPPPVRARGVA